MSENLGTHEMVLGGLNGIVTKKAFSFRGRRFLCVGMAHTAGGGHG